MSESRDAEVEVAHLGRMGDGVVAAHRGEPVYVRGALPGELVRIGPPVRDKRIVRASLREVLRPSPARRAPRCSVVDRCGGCPLAHLAREAQLDAKVAWLTESLRAQGIAIEAHAIERDAPSPGTGYRTRARLAWEPAGTGAALGYRVARGHDVVVPARCEVLAPRLEAARDRITRALARALAGAGELHLALSSAGEATEGVVAGITSESAQPTAVFDAVTKLVAEGTLLGASVQVGGATVPTSYGAPVERSRDVDGRELAARVGSFRQAHVAAAHVLGRRVVDWARVEGEDVVELYAGHGHFSLALAARARSLVAVEREPDAVRALRDNAAAHGLHLEAHAEDAASALSALVRRRARAGVVVLDPPRVGAADAIASIVALGPSRVVYVACDAASFARDAGTLARAGLWLTRLCVADLFPDTLHIELVGLLERDRRALAAPRPGA